MSTKTLRPTQPSALLARLLTSTATALLVGTLATAAGPAVAADTSSAAGQLDSYMRMRGSNDGREVFANWWVTVFAALPGEKPRELFRLDGYNVGRFIKAEDGSAQLVTREVAYYRDLKTGKFAGRALWGPGRVK